MKARTTPGDIENGGGQVLGKHILITLRGWEIQRTLAFSKARSFQKWIERVNDVLVVREFQPFTGLSFPHTHTVSVTKQATCILTTLAIASTGPPTAFTRL